MELKANVVNLNEYKKGNVLKKCITFPVTQVNINNALWLDRRKNIN